MSLGVGDGITRVPCLVDTGAAVSLMRENEYYRLCKLLKRPAWLSPSVQLHSVNGGQLQVCGESEFKFDKCSPVTLVIVKDILTPCILGMDFLVKAKAQLTFDKQTVRLFDTRYVYMEDVSGDKNIEVVHESTGSDVIDNVLRENDDVFSTDQDKLGRCHVEPCVINTGDAEPIMQRPRRLPLEKRAIIEEEIDKMMDEGVIRPSSSPWSSPVVIVTKKDGSARFCIDYRKLNSVTISDSYSLPSIQEIFDSMAGATIFSTIDLTSGYHQFTMKPEDIPKTCFCTHVGNFEFLRMPFGLKNAPGQFQRVMNKVLAGLIGRVCYVYLDDIVIFSRNPTEHAEHLQQVFSRLRDANLKIKRKKCFFAKSSVDLLGYHINKEGIAPQSEKVSAIRNMTAPTDKTAVRSFLGMTNYYRQCIPGYAQLSRPLQDLTSPKASFKWEDEQQRAFEQLKATLTSDQVMAYPRIGEPYRLYTDACDYAVGAILTQTDEHGLERPVHYVSHQLDSCQRRWATIEKEAFAIVYALKKLRPYLWGAQFTILTDHKPLRSLFLGEVANTKIQRWAVLIAEFGAPIEYREGKNNVRADMLSRIHTIATIDTYAPLYTVVEQDEVDLFLADGIDRNELAAAQKEEFGDLFDDAKEKDGRYIVSQANILYSNTRPYPTAELRPRVVLPLKYRQQVIEKSHEASGHSGLVKTMKRTQDCYLWPGMRRSHIDQLSKCPTCLTHQSKTHRHPYSEMPLAGRPFELIAIDLVGPLPESMQGNKYIFTCIDHAIGWVEAYPIPDKRCVTVEGVIKNRLFPQHGYPQILLFDNGKEFNNAEWLKALGQHGIEVRRSTAYHPETNGRLERFHRTIKEMISRLVNNRPGEWENRLGAALLAYRNNVSTVTGYTPFFLLYGRSGRLPLSAGRQVEQDHDFSNRLYDHDEALNHARENTALSRHYNRERINKRAREQGLQPGDAVVYKAPNRVTFTARYDPRWTVVKIRGPVVWLKHDVTGKSRTTNIDKLKIVDREMAWDEIRKRPSRQQQSTPVTDNDIDQWLTEKEQQTQDTLTTASNGTGTMATPAPMLDATTRNDVINSELNEEAEMTDISLQTNQDAHMADDASTNEETVPMMQQTPLHSYNLRKRSRPRQCESKRRRVSNQNVSSIYIVRGTVVDNIYMRY